MTFPFGVHELLAAERRRGLSWDEAWKAIDGDRLAREAGFGERARYVAGSVESPLAFAKRHLQAAYELRTTMRYCAAVDCERLAIDGDFCIWHANAIKENAA